MDRRTALRLLGALGLAGAPGTIGATATPDEDDEERLQCPLLCDGTELDPAAEGLRCPACDVVKPRERWRLMIRDQELGCDEITATAEAEVPREVYEVVRDRADVGDASISECFMDYTTIEIVWRHAETGEVILDERD